LFQFIDFRGLDCCCFGFCIFGLMGSAAGDWVIVGPVDVHRKYRIYTILGEKKKNRADFFFLNE